VKLDHLTSPRNCGNVIAMATAIEIVPAGGDRFHAYVGGRKLCTSRTPFLTAARILLRNGLPPETPIVMRHKGSATISLRSTVGAASSLSVSTKGGRPVFRRRRDPLAGEPAAAFSEAAE
jgi:hypothetical protein